MAGRDGWTCFDWLKAGRKVYGRVRLWLTFSLMNGTDHCSDYKNDCEVHFYYDY